ncbi:hypothetical protein BIU88_04075 [Chlorobaculum limnaeum]|uniref:Cadherin domain-containing protein n=1 Tax=Chlorobaculum limnaeum TaxID=274537 RepID=A0A1D8CZ31_CHLLM|nr:choice-of-anchor I family protein [Chlorobaculum limnaeum]AOS83391.1 hypothetical protein BIU88_04075 [Chlorobaculum limnaeum]
MVINPNPLLNASVDGPGNVVTLYFSDKLDTSSVPALDQFAVFSDGIEQVITAIQLVNNQVILTLAASLDSLLPVTVSYTSSSDTLQNINGDDVASFEDAEVDNQLSLTASESESFTFASTITMDYGAEISAFDPSSQRLFVTSPEGGLQILGIDDQLQMTKFATIELGSNMVNSVAVKNGIVAVAVADADKTQPGKVYFLDAGATILDASMILGSVEVGANPDMLTFTPDGSKVLVANEGEMASESSDPEGSVSIIDLSEVLAGKATEPTVTTAGFTAFNSQLDALKEAGVRLFAGEDGFESTTVAQDLEPEYISISPDGTTAFVTLQENNAIAILDIASGTFTGIVPLGLKSFSSLPFDGSDKDGIDLQTGQPVYGKYMPDAIASFTGSDGKTYYVIANEGDDRDDFLATPETARVKDLVLDSTVFPDAATLQGNNELGRLTVSNASGNNGDTDGDGDIDQLLAYGARSFSILDSEGNIVFDSASHIEQFVAQYGLYTGAAGAGLFDDGRSDNKGPEPEGITVGVVDGKTLAFVTLERGGGGVMVYDVTNPEEVSFVQYLAHSGDVSPEGVLFISAADSPTGHELLIVSNEVSNTVTIFQENHAPELVDGYSDVTVMEDQAFDRVLVVENMFSDADEDDTLTYTVTLANGDPLPTWLTVSETEQNLDEMLDYFKSGGQWPATDSASAGTAIATGVKTVDGNIAWERTDSAGGEIETIAETLRGELGYAIGVASTVPFSHATPATFVSHDVSRNNYWDIAHEILFETQPEVVIGGGMENSNFAKAVKSAGNVDRDLDDNGYNDDYDAFVNDTDGTEYVFVKREEGEDGGDTLAAAAATVDLSAGEKLFGLYGTSGGNFEYYNVYDTPGIATITRSTTDATPTVDEDPTLAEVTNVSLSVLNQDADGFFIMIEQGDIDWRNHANDYENMIGGVYDLEMAVTAAENYVASGVNGIDWSNTLVIVTSDHSNSYLRAQEELGMGDLPEQNGKSYPDGEVTYASGGHTNELVTVSARGAGATYFGELAGQIYDGTEIIDNTQIYEAMMKAATEAGAEHIILFIGDGMNVEHEIAGSRYLYGEDFGLTWHDWGTLEDGWSGYASTWDVTAYNKYASMAGVDSYSETTFDPLIGYDPAKGGVTPYPVEMPESFTLSGTPGNDEVGSIEIKVTATDKSGVSVSDTFTLTVENTNDAPMVANAIADQGATEDAAFSFTVPSNTFNDVDAGDTLSYTATLADGSVLPGWLSFNAGTRTFSGTPDNDEVGSIEIKVTATDESGVSVSDTFTLTVENTNDAPEVGRAIENVTVLEDGKLNYHVLSNSFTDVDAGDTFTYTATLANGDPLPDWLNFDASSHNLETMEKYFLAGGSAKKATDSASAGTAIATGVKTVDGNIAWERTDSAGGEIETIAETLRGELGYAIGVASTVPFSHATPATFVSHDVSRNNYWDIAHEILFETQPEVVIGGGMENSNFAKAVKSAGNVDRDLDDNGYNDDYDAFVNDTDGTEYVFVKREEGEDGGDTLAAAAATVDLSAGEKLFGLYGTSGGNFEYYNVYDTPGIATITRSTTDATPTVDEDPTLAEVTNVSLSVLNQDADGFFIMIEQGDIDWRNHANDYENMIGGVYDLEMAVTAAENYVASGVNGIDWSNTLVIVTSDHSNSYLRAQEELGMGDLPEQNGKSYPDGEVTYASGGHTNELVTVSARGAGATYFGELAGQIYDGTEIIDNTQIYEAMMKAATEAGAEHIILFIGDGMNVEHEIAGSRYLYGEDFGLTWHDWGTLEDGWSGYASTWDVTAYNTYAGLNGVDDYVDFDSANKVIGYDPAQGGETPYPVAMTFSGTPGHEDVGSIEIKVTATDKSGVSVSDTFTLTVVDDVAPTVTASNPADEAAAVDVNGTITFEFSEEIELLDETGVVLHAGSVDGTVVDADVSVTGSTLMVDPTGALVNGTEYYLTFDGDAVCDLAGNYYDDDESDVFHFTTLEAAVAATGGSSDGLGAGEMLAGVAGIGLLAFLIF